MATKLSSAEVIKRIQAIHKDIYDLSHVVYINKRTKIKLICKEHGAWETTIEQVCRGQGCRKCGKLKAGKSRRLSFEEFVSKANQIHKSKYQYFIEKYTKSSLPIEILCPKHGLFNIIASVHIGTQKQGCPKCGRLSQISKRKMDSEEFISKAKQVHNTIHYDYSKINYKNNKTKIEVICPKHGSFFPSPDNHLQGSGCPSCGIEKVHLGQMKNLETFISDSIKVHGHKYDYSLTEYTGGKRTVQIICQKHGPFLQTPNAHQKGSGCPNCNTSKGEDKVKRILKNLNIDFKQQHTFEKLIDKRKLKCDFYLLEFNLVIEFNGRQHYEPVNRFGGINGLFETQKRDQIKRDYLKRNNIELLEIHYLDKDIEKTIVTKLKIV